MSGVDFHTKLMLHMDGTDDAQVFTDDSDFVHTVTPVGDAKTEDTEKKFGTTSAYFDGTGDKLTIPDSPHWDVGDGDFTVDFWIKRVASATRQFLFGQSDGGATEASIGVMAEIDTSNQVKGGITVGSTIYYVTSSAIDTGWHHVALVRHSDTLELFIDGASEDTYDATGKTVNSPSTVFGVGGLGGYGGLLTNAYIDEFRYSPGIARWTAAFTPPTAAYSRSFVGGIDKYVKLMLHMDGTDDAQVFTDSSDSEHTVTAEDNAKTEDTQKKFGVTSGYFDGTGDYLSLADHADWDFGTGDFTIDFWMYRSASYGGGKDLVSSNQTSTPGWLVHLASALLYFYHNGSNIYSVSYTEVLSTWEHYAFVREGDNMYWFVDGVQQGATGTGHSARDINGSAFLKIAGRGTAADPNCYVDELRISKGIARWTEAFTPPSSPYSRTSDWANVLEIEIDNTNVDSELTNFPMLVHLSASCGIGDADMSAVFDELTADANRFKIAVTEDDGETETKVEIQEWDDGNEQAWLWVLVPTVASGAVTTMYLYFDVSQGDNTENVGDIGSTPGKAVWDDNFLAVYHMCQDPDGDVADAILDSTSDGFHGTPYGSMLTADLVTGQIGKALEFDGSNDSIFTDDPAGGDFDVTDDMTIEVITKPTDPQVENYGMLSLKSSVNSTWTLFVNLVYYTFRIQVSGGEIDSTTQWDEGVFHNLAATYDKSNTRMYVQGIEEDSAAYSTSIPTNNGDLYIGGQAANNNMTGIMEEVRFSDIARSAAWLKATYYSNFDLLVTLSLEGEGPDYTLDFAAGAYAIAGTAIGLLKDWNIDFGVGSYSIAGTDISLKRVLKIIFESGSYDIVGSSITLSIIAILIRLNSIIEQETPLDSEIEQETSFASLIEQETALISQLIKGEE